MANGKCKRRVGNFARWVARTLGPHIIQIIVGIVAGFDAIPGTILSNQAKRAAVIDAAKAAYAREKGLALEAVGGEVERAIRAALENALHHVRANVPAVELADADDDDLADEAVA